jgi:hypothetical protein
MRHVDDAAGHRVAHVVTVEDPGDCPPACFLASIIPTTTARLRASREAFGSMPTMEPQRYAVVCALRLIHLVKLVISRADSCGLQDRVYINAHIFMTGQQKTQ